MKIRNVQSIRLGLLFKWEARFSNLVRVHWYGLSKYDANNITKLFFQLQYQQYTNHTYDPWLIFPCFCLPCFLYHCQPFMQWRPKIVNTDTESRQWIMGLAASFGLPSFTLQLLVAFSLIRHSGWTCGDHRNRVVSTGNSKGLCHSLQRKVEKMQLYGTQVFSVPGVIISWFPSLVLDLIREVVIDDISP